MKKEHLAEEIEFKKCYMISMLNMIQDMIQQLGNQIKQEMTAISESVKRIEPEEENKGNLPFKTINEMREFYAKLNEQEKSQKLQNVGENRIQVESTEQAVGNGNRKIPGKNNR